ncbi:unnamed protein product [Rotaria sp. Silwood2]|nr:unnamed protein product [Rotaria sp. Silwood2]CAF4339493.1 unnamed protein product [Rotaria sp. Silwood2]
MHSECKLLFCRVCTIYSNFHDFPIFLPDKFVPKTIDEHRCCLLPRICPHIHPVNNSNDSINHVSNNESQEYEQKQKVEAYVFTKLEEYSREKSIRLFHLTSFSRIRRRLKRDVKYLSKQFEPYNVSERKILQWIDDTLERINSHFPHLRSLIDSQNELKQLFLTDEFFSSNNNNNQWRKLQIKRAKILFPDTDNNENELILKYQKYIIENLTPNKLESDCLPLKNKEKIDLNSEYNKAENIGREYLKNIFDDYKKRQYPNLNLIKEMINLGMEQMKKRPKLDELHQASTSSNMFSKALFMLRSKNAYSMSLKNLADDFMFLRFGRSLGNQNNKKDSVTERFTLLIHMFLNTISILIHSVKSDTPEISSSLFSQFDSNLSSENILSPIIHIDQWTWLVEKWKIALQTFPINLTKHGAFGRLVRTTIGVGVARLYGFAENNEHDELDKKLFQALQMGFYYGVAYALVDGLQDNQNEQQQHHIDIDKWLIEMERILCGHKLDRNSLPKLPITSLLLETFHSLMQLTSINSIAEQTFTDLALLLRSQRSDKKNLERSYNNDIDAYIGPLLKSHFTYSATAFMGGARMIHDRQRLWTMPFLGQLTDDCRDFDEDRREKSITPVTYFVEHNDSILNPFFVFLFVSEDLYTQSHRERDTGAFLGRRIIRTLRSLQNDLNEFLTIFTAKSYPDFYKYALSLVNLFDRVSDPEKAIFRFINKFAIGYSFNHRNVETYAYDHLSSVEKQITIKTNENDPLIRGINHSLKAGGKRLRPLMLLMVAQICNIDIERVIPLARAIEYLHTSSLIFDDLPAQDNAPLRRGQPTLHMPIETDNDEIPPSLTEGRAQLAAVNLIAHAIRLVTVDLRQQGFSYESINRVTAELSQSMDELCHGQFLDLQAARLKKSLTIPELDHIAELKTGKAIEIVFICPVILAEQDKSLNITLESLRELGKLMGILFQMKDDLLDVEGNINEIGKLTNIDQQNQTVTYISLLGIDKTRKRIDTKRKQAEFILNSLWPQAGTIHDVIRHICERQK